MNEKMNRGTSLYHAGVTSPEQVIKLVSKRMLETRPKHDIRLRPYLEQPIRQWSPFGSYDANFNEIWSSEGTCGDGTIAYAAACFHADREQEVILTLNGSIKLWLNGVPLISRLAGSDLSTDRKMENRFVAIPARMKAGWNDMLIKCVRYRNEWGFSLTVGFPRYPMMWAKDYLFSTRPTLPHSHLRGEEGFAYTEPIVSLCSDWTEEELLIRLETPLPPETEQRTFDIGFVVDKKRYLWHPVQRPEGTVGDMDEAALEETAASGAVPAFVDFSRLFAPSSACAYALTYYELHDHDEGVLRIFHRGMIAVWVEGKEVHRSFISGDFELLLPAAVKRCEILVKSVRSEAEWGIRTEIVSRSGSRLDTVPIVETKRGDEARWLYIGPFGSIGTDSRTLLEMPFEVEQEVRFDRPYPTGEGKNLTFWQLQTADTAIRPYMDSFFFGQWFYAIQVGLYGLLLAAEKVGNAEHSCYATDSMAIMAQYHDYAQWDSQRFDVPSLMPRSMDLHELDPCGAIGVMMIETYKRTAYAPSLPVIDRLADAVMCAVPRFADDGTYYRIDTMWADDLFMSCPFLVRLGQLTGERRYFDEAVRQVKGFHDRLWMADKQLYSHIYFPNEGLANRVPWGRGNGWVIFALSEILMHLPMDHAGWNVLPAMFKEFAAGIVRYQADSGIWHQVLDEPDSYEETSCTAMFLLSLVRGIRNGWLDDTFMPHVRKGWQALLEYCIDNEGNVYGVCLGSGCSMDKQYYYDIPTYMNDDHGTGVVLLAAAEMACLLEK